MTSSFERVGRSRPMHYPILFFSGGGGGSKDVRLLEHLWPFKRNGDNLKSQSHLEAKHEARAKRCCWFPQFINWLVMAPEVQFSRSHEVIVQTTAISNMYNCSFLQRKNWDLCKTPITSNALLWRCSAKSRESFTPTDLQRNKYNIGWNKFARRHDQSEALPSSG